MASSLTKILCPKLLKISFPFSLVFDLFTSLILATFCVTERESVAMLARFDVKGDTKAAHLFYQNFKFVLLFFSKNAQCIANKFAHLKLILRYLKLLLWEKFYFLSIFCISEEYKMVTAVLKDLPFPSKGNGGGPN